MQRVNALAQDNAFGQPLESRLRSVPARDLDLRGNEVATLLAKSSRFALGHSSTDAANPTEVMRDVVAFATAGLRLRQRRRSPGQRVVAP